MVLGWFEADFLWQQSQAKEFGGWTETMIRARREFVGEHVELVGALLQTGVEVYILDDTTNAYSLPDTLSELGLEAPEIHVVPFVPSVPGGQDLQALVEGQRSVLRLSG